jgi:glycosyltransferase involved in cell wall biosynthesis
MSGLYNTPLVSVVMSFRNPGNGLTREVESILQQTFTDWELVAINDGSTDDSGKLIENVDDSRIRLITFKQSAGLPIRLNHGVQQARGRYIARMDADDFAFPERLERQVSYLQQNHHVELLASASLMVDKAGRPLGVLSSGLNHKDICNKPFHGFRMSHPTWMGRTEWFRAHPYKSDALKGQDQILLLETYQHSCFAGLPDVLLAYRYDGLSVRKTILGRYLYFKYLLKSGSLKEVILGLFVHFAAGLRDVSALLLSLDSAVIKSRTVQADKTLIKKWNKMSVSSLKR